MTIRLTLSDGLFFVLCTRTKTTAYKLLDNGVGRLKQRRCFQGVLSTKKREAVSLLKESRSWKNVKQYVRQMMTAISQLGFFDEN